MKTFVPGAGLPEKKAAGAAAAGGAPPGGPPKPDVEAIKVKLWWNKNGILQGNFY